jgi:arginase family enzyme
MKLIRPYFKPVNSDLYEDKDRWETTQIGRNIETHIQDSFPDVKFAEIAVFNIPEYEGSGNTLSESDCKIRALFYSFHHHNLPRVVDLGVLELMPSRKETFNIIEIVCKELLHNGIIPFVIGGGHDLSYAVYKAYASLDKFINLTTVDSKFDIGLEDDNLASFSHLGKMISHKPSHLFHYTNLGYQSYFVSSIATDMLQAMNFDTIRLGELKANFNEVEPIMRNTDFLSFDISAIQYAYAQANVYSSPNGLNGEDACKIMRYAGVSDKITAIGLFEYNQDLDINNQTAYLLAEMLWYFIDGYKIRKNELNPNMKDCAKYTVAFEDGKNEITFYKSQSSGRWWMGVPFRREGMESPQNYYIACSYRDYEISNKGEVPERWLKTANKFL